MSYFGLRYSNLKFKVFINGLAFILECNIAELILQYHNIVTNEYFFCFGIVGNYATKKNNKNLTEN